MWPHFLHLFWRTIYGMPLVVSSNWASWALGLAIFVLYEVLAVKFRGWHDVVSRWKQNVGIGLLATFGGYVLLFAYSAIITTYDEHHDSIGRWQAVVNEKNSLKIGLQQRDDYIRKLEGKSCPVCPAHPKSSASEPQPRALSELQLEILRRDLKPGIGLEVRINAIGGKQDTLDLAQDLREVFKGWKVGGGNIGAGPPYSGDADLEFVIPHPEADSVQIAIHAFEHAHVIYGKTVNAYAYCGPISLGPPPALTINVRDR